MKTKLSKKAKIDQLAKAEKIRIADQVRKEAFKNHPSESFKKWRESYTGPGWTGNLLRDAFEAGFEAGKNP